LYVSIPAKPVPSSIAIVSMSAHRNRLLGRLAMIPSPVITSTGLPEIASQPKPAASGATIAIARMMVAAPCERVTTFTSRIAKHNAAAPLVQRR
jgi:hypothetical protein